MFEGLEHADELGSLLQIEEPVEKELQHLKQLFESQTGKLYQEDLFQPTVVQGELPLGVESYEAWKEKALKRLKEHFAREAVSADLTQAFFSRDVGKGLSLFDLLSRRYDVVAANPPYMGSKNMNSMMKKYVDRSYRPGKRDLYAAFILRCLELSKEGGRVGMVSQQSWMFLRSFADLRALDKDKLQKAGDGSFTGILRETTIETLAHLGPGAFEEISGEVVNIVLFIFAHAIPPPEHRLTAFRLVGPKSAQAKVKVLREALNALK